MLDWDDLQAFLAIARAGSLSAAARSLGVQQTTMGRRLQGLEARAGVRLLLKTPRGFTLTAAGEAILGNVERIEAEALAVERRITGRDIRLEGTVRLTTIELFADDLLIPALADFRAKHPGITLEVSAEARNLSLTRREADIALRVGRLEQADLAVRKVATLGTGVYASPDYLARHGMPDFSAGAPGHTTILNPLDAMAQTQMAWFATLTHAATPAMRHNSRYGQRAAALAGIGLAVLSRYTGDTAPLTRLPTPTQAPNADIFLAVHNDTRHTPRIRAVTDLIATTLRTHALALAPGS